MKREIQTWVNSEYFRKDIPERSSHNIYLYSHVDVMLMIVLVFYKNLSSFSPISHRIRLVVEGSCKINLFITKIFRKLKIKRTDESNRETRENLSILYFSCRFFFISSSFKIRIAFQSIVSPISILFLLLLLMF